MKMNWDNLFWRESECVRPEEQSLNQGGLKNKYNKKKLLV